MLVAFQRTGDERRLPAAAEHLVGLLRSWGPGPDHLTGLALAGITVPSRGGPRVVDALVFTRSGVVVIAAHEPGAGVSPGPEERAGAGVAAAKGALAAHDGGRYVTGLVAVVPPVAESDRGGRLAEPAGEPHRFAAGPDASGRAGDTAAPGWGGGEEVAAGPPESRSVGDPRPGSRPGGSDDLDARPPEPRSLGDPRPGSGSSGEDLAAGPPEPRWAGDPRPDSGPGGTADPIAGLPEPRSAGDPISPESAPSPREGQLEPNGPETLPHPRVPESVPGVAVVLADPRGLRRIIGQHNRWRTVWSADDVLDACYALSLAHLAPPRSALLADGFPARIHARSPLPVLPAVVELPPSPLPPPVAEARPALRIPVQRTQAVFPRQRPIRLVPWGLLVVLTLLVTAGVVAAVFVAQVFHGS
ncbi:hypothetical protein ACIRSS_44195 [Amycolatopsis sp. NPDC101161]|uniref:hypothetical protein n=1 Tax=Amycolatopsis sp. NPDC101161 TaxID=3363940 RepID=UPI00382048B7